MALFRALTASGGGGGSTVINNPTVTHNNGTEISTSWDFDAKCAFLFGLNAGSAWDVWLFDLTNNKTYYWYAWGNASSGEKWWQHSITDAFNTHTFTQRSLAVTTTCLNLSNVTVIPLSDYPNGYFA